MSEKEPTRVVIGVAGLGYEVFIPLSSYDRLPPPEASVRILTYEHIREDARQLYGFMTVEERAVFLLLMTVSGIGPKVALNILSGLAARDIKAAIAQGDVKRLSSISGIGKKTAARMIVELRDKIGAGEALEAISGAETSPDGIKMRDAILALVSLGFKQVEAHKMVKEVLLALGPDAPVEDVVRKALANR